MDFYKYFEHYKHVKKCGRQMRQLDSILHMEEAISGFAHPNKLELLKQNL